MSDEWMDNPIFQRRGSSETAAMTRYSPPSEKPTQTAQRRVPAGIRKMILELGFRFRPSGADDVKAHTAKLEIMAADLFDVPEHALSLAISEWIRTEKFMPKAAELIALARDAVKPGAISAQAWCDQRNAGMPDKSQDRGKEWYVDGEGSARMRWICERRDMTGELCTPDEAAHAIKRHGIG